MPPASAYADVARRGLAVLRSMRGAAGHLAQLADFADPRWAPAAEREKLEAELAHLRAGAREPLDAKRVERLLRGAWGGKLSDHLEDLGDEPVALAAAGQVHRATLEDGRAVAVKLVHPGAEDALRADLVNVALLAQLGAAIVPGLDARAIAGELRERALEELDLEHEAQAMRTFARAYRGHPFVFVPAPVTELCHTGVLVAEWVDGTAFEDVLELDQEARDRYGEILVRFHTGAMLHTGAFHADPHPGNHRLLDDGRVAFLDYGATGRADAAWLAGLLDAADALEQDDADRFKRDLAGLGYLAAPERLDGGALLAHARASAGPLLSDDPVRIDQDLALAAMEAQAEHAGTIEDLLRHGRVPARDLQAGRMMAGLGAVLARLEARAPWGAIAAEPRRGGAPATPLGEQDAAFWAGRGHSRADAVQGLRRAAA
ncbi:MAG TPA: AarF/UbiB family protein [Solirubrobacteraceae bacterium]